VIENPEQLSAAAKPECEFVHIPGSDLPAPKVTYLVRERVWRLEDEYIHRLDDCHMHIPSGFTFDLASIPRPLWRIIAPFELSIVAPLCHDWLYRFGGTPAFVHPDRTWTREEADHLFHADMIAEGVSRIRARTAYRAVRMFGGRAWRQMGRIV